MVKSLQSHVESISAFRKSIDNFTNDDFDRVVSILGSPVIKQAVYNTRIDFAGKVGSALKMVKKS